MKIFKLILSAFVFLYSCSGSAMFSGKAKWFVGTTGVGILTSTNAYHSYIKRTKAIEKERAKRSEPTSELLKPMYRDRRSKTGAAVGLAVVATVGTAILLHEPVPAVVPWSRALQTCMHVQTHPLLQPGQNSKQLSEIVKKMGDLHNERRDLGNALALIEGQLTSVDGAQERVPCVVARDQILQTQWQIGACLRDVERHRSLGGLSYLSPVIPELAEKK